ncbi:hypothetical protein M0R45_018872 [Rubus argutus]|uniref:Reverse transcriptase domain-containing protein n=1 Tax=Rubus argutus TaxID=59490 RepID=A0AAW1X5F3_RUBAR
MNVLSWNCRGVGMDPKIFALKDLITKTRPSIVFLCETKIDNLKDFRQLALSLKGLGFTQAEEVLSDGRSGVLGLFWVDEVRVRSKSAHFIESTLEGSPGDPSWRLTGFYGHPKTSLHHLSWQAIRDHCDDDSLPWVIVEDFNEILHADEKQDGRRRGELQMWGFREIVGYTELVDLRFVGTKFTWSNRHTKIRLDRALATNSWSEIFPQTCVYVLPPFISNHSLFLLQASVGSIVRVQRFHHFHFESFWLQHPECNQTQVQIQGIRNRLAMLLDCSITPTAIEEKQSLVVQLQQLTSQEETYWTQRAKVAWLKEGDSNTGYFHRKASNRPRKNNLVGLFDENGLWRDNEEGMEEVVTSYFQRMFNAGEVDQVALDATLNAIQPYVTVEMNQALCAPYSMEEIRVALFQMYPTKSPALDGMPPLFYQHYWDLIGEDLTSVVQNFLHSGQLLKQINFTHICLIPKVTNPQNMVDLRPIALCNVIYKICSKTIANRMKIILPQIISPFPSSFVPSRLITDNILATNEVAHFIHNQRTGDEYMALKLDLSKAYDHMEWTFLCKGWQILEYPDSLIASILAAKDLIKCGMRWQIGTGTSVSTWIDPWLPKLPSFLPIPRLQEEVVESRIADFILPSRSWDRQRVLNTFVVSDAMLILVIPLSDHYVGDRRIWHSDSKGIFSVKSAYKMALALYSSEVLSAPTDLSGEPFVPFWKCIWHAPIPALAKVCVWKASLGILPTVDRLLAKQVPIEDVVCNLCHMEPKTILHICGMCTYSKVIFQAIPAILELCYPPDRVFTNFFEWLLHCFQALPKINFHRSSFILDFESTPPISGGRHRSLQWKRPPVGWLKVNIDEAFSASEQMGEICVIIRDDEGNCVGGKCERIQNVTSPEHVEALAGRCVVRLVQEK